MAKDSKITFNKYITILLNILVCIFLLILCVKLVYIHILAMKMVVSTSIDGMNKYFGLYKDNSFTEIIGTILVGITALIYISQLEVANATLADKIFNDKFNEWSTQIKSGTLEYSSRNEKMCNQFILKGRPFFEKLFFLKMKIKNKGDLENILSIYKNDVYYFEIYDDEYMSRAGSYYNNSVRYSYDTCKFLFLLTIEEEYEDLRKDLDYWYKNMLPIKDDGGLFVLACG